jgi:hypothetical protein
MYVGAGLSAMMAYLAARRYSDQAISLTNKE